MHGTQLLHAEFSGAHAPFSQNPQMQRPQKQPKALRFVTNYGAPHPKRRRVGAACLTCRKRKTACSGERPTCDTCKQNKLECAGYSSEAPTAPGQRKAPSDPAGRQAPGASDDEAEQHRKRPSAPKQTHSNSSIIDPALTGSTREDDDRLSWGRSNISPTAFNSHPPNRQEQIPQSDINGDGANSLFPRPRDRMPYFRWLGPTAIMPGFKQMVVKVKRQDGDPMARSSTNGEPPGRLSPNTSNDHLAPGNASRLQNQYPTGQASVDSDTRSAMNLPFYDNSPMPPSELITHLASTFFTHLGCNYPFLQRERFLRDLEEKQVDVILVDAVCALAARFSTHPLLTSQTHLPAPGPSGQDKEDKLNKATPAEYGHVFAQRAKAALVDAFPCPSVAVVQAALLLAYLEFGESRDSGLWMYLGISIRMAQDLGLHTVEGLKYIGMDGLTPKIIRRESSSDSKKHRSSSSRAPSQIDDLRSSLSTNTPVERATSSVTPDANVSTPQIDEQKAVEQERMDTFWAVFFLDRVVSSGTGRRSTLRDKDIELSFPPLEEPGKHDGWPGPFPALIRIIHLYGRVADLLNGIKEPSDINSDTSKRLAAMESQVTQFYQGLSPRLHFDAVNFQHYMKAGEGTNFVLLHFWFHTLIVLLHQPTLLKTFEGKMLQLFPNSQQLSMSSAKTIADILSYSQLIDAKASLGNPFTSQPIYIAACAFLKETAEQTVSSTAQSRASSPSRKTLSDSRPASRPDSINGTPRTMENVAEFSSADSLTKDTNKEPYSGGPFKRSSALPFGQQTSEQHKSLLSKHTLLATAASQHYQLCYKALQSLETYWAGAKYILTILDQKFQGVEDPLLYTVEESESSMEIPRPVPEFRSPGWRRNMLWDPALPGAYLSGSDGVGMELAQSPFWKARSSLGEVDLSKAIGWTLTGTMNSPSTNLAWHYPTGNIDGAQMQQIPTAAHYNSMPPPAYPSPSLHGQDSSAQNMTYPQHGRAGSVSKAPQGSVSLPSHPHSGSNMSNVDAADLLLGLNNAYQGFRNDATSSNFSPPNAQAAVNAAQNSGAGAMTMNMPANNMQFPNPGSSTNSHNAWMTNPAMMQPFGDMMIESQDVDMSMLGLDMMPWFDNYPTHDLTGMLDTRNLGPSDAHVNPNRGGAGGAGHTGSAPRNGAG